MGPGRVAVASVSSTSALISPVRRNPSTRWKAETAKKVCQPAKPSAAPTS
jgi:hypothetical protein